MFKYGVGDVFMLGILLRSDVWFEDDIKYGFILIILLVSEDLFEDGI